MFSCGPAFFAPAAANLAGVIALLRYEGPNGSTSFIDSGPLSRTVARIGTPTISTANPKFGAAAGTFAAAGLSIAGADCVFAGDFCAETWAFITGAAAQNVFCFGANNDGTTLSCYRNGNGITLVRPNAATNTGGGTFTLNAYKHVCIERSGSVITAYIDGAAVTTLSYSGAVGNSGILRFGADQVGTGQATGQYDDTRVSAFARYKGNFTPPGPL